ncbi:hypothetical protein V490_03169 [Pseudogymnoascus sp. VKM F-3557]|nr:hypothetical protein V490_03169 [Pseudogymnoascus sp. VKM F-3557]
MADGDSFTHQVSTLGAPDSPFYTPKLESLSEEVRSLLENYSGIEPDLVVPHIEEMRDRAWKIYPYPCIGMFRFVNVTLLKSPHYPNILSRLKNDNHIFLDLGCCFGSEIRQLTADGAPSENLYGSDLRLEFWELGYDLFRDREKLKSSFLVGDVFDSSSELGKLDGKVDIIHAASFFHLFTYEQQLEVGKRIVKLLRPVEGSLVLGRMVGNTEPGLLTSKDGKKTLYRHNEESWAGLWREISELTGVKFEVKSHLVDTPGHMRFFNDAPRPTPLGGVQLWWKHEDYLLSQSFIALKRNGPTGRLASLSLRVAVPPDAVNESAGYIRRLMWEEPAVDIFLSTFRALSTSQLRIESLDLFNSSGRRRRRGLPCNALSSVDWDDEGLTESLSSLRSLSIGLSKRFFKFDEDAYGHVINYYDEPYISMVRDGKNFTGLASLFKILKNLNSFELYFFTLLGELPETDWFLQHLVALSSLPNLTRCKLRGIYATETDLLAFIKRTRVSDLSLRQVKLSSGSFRSIFDYCTSTASPISKLDFKDLYEKDREPSPYVLFLETASSMFDYGAHERRTNFLTRNGDDINQPISYNTDVRSVGVIRLSPPLV